MIDDYRTTPYCHRFEKIVEKKSAICNAILRAHPCAKDMHTYISKNKSAFKKQFLSIYNYKCAYCGVSIDIIAKQNFEVDHYLCIKLFPSKEDAGFIENLVLSCHDCNHKKGDLSVPEDDHELFHPDKKEITEIYCRDDDYYIRISGAYTNNKTANALYDKLNLGGEVHRLDYLLMNMIGLKKEIEQTSPIDTILGNAIIELLQKRNLI